MSNRRMKIYTTDFLFSTIGVQTKTAENWSRAVLNAEELRTNMATILKNWFEIHELHIEDPGTKFSGWLGHELSQITGGRIKYTVAARPEFRINGVGPEELLNMTQQSDKQMAVLPLTIAGLHRVFFRCHGGHLPGVDWCMSMPGCVITAISLGGQIAER